MSILEPQENESINSGYIESIDTYTSQRTSEQIRDLDTYIQGFKLFSIIDPEFYEDLWLFAELKKVEYLEEKGEEYLLRKQEQDQESIIGKEEDIESEFNELNKINKLSKQEKLNRYKKWIENNKIRHEELSEIINQKKKEQFDIESEQREQELEIRRERLKQKEEDLRKQEKEIELQKRDFQIRRDRNIKDLKNRSNINEWLRGIDFDIPDNHNTHINSWNPGGLEQNKQNNKRHLNQINQNYNEQQGQEDSNNKRIKYNLRSRTSF